MELNVIINLQIYCKINIRYGIHYGDIALGIMGNKNPKLHIVGNAVNFASRLNKQVLVIKYMLV